MGDSNRDDGSSRYWKTRTMLEFVKLGLWIVWECLRRPIGPL
jgi:hypothetical protein